MAAPRKAKLDQSVTLLWTNGANFNGWLWLGVVPPTLGTDWAEIAMGDQQPNQRIPTVYWIPIVDGKYHASSSVFFNEDLEPPNTQYVARFFDSTRRSIAGPSANFTVTTDPFAPATPTLTVPTAGGTPPTPDS